MFGILPISIAINLTNIPLLLKLMINNYIQLNALL